MINSGHSLNDPLVGGYLQQEHIQINIQQSREILTAKSEETIQEYAYID